MRLINADLAIKRIQEQADKFDIPTIIAWLSNLSIECESISWHKVEKDGLPKKYGMYLVTLNKRDTDFCEYYPEKQQFGFSGNICDEVTAWAYLPKPCED